jgi:hypothetical protein
MCDLIKILKNLALTPEMSGGDVGVFTPHQLLLVQGFSPQNNSQQQRERKYSPTPDQQIMEALTPDQQLTSNPPHLSWWPCEVIKLLNC